ncbi:MAG TPA: hypothetical protein VMT85_07605 [Thermoanaerobaculia bacterium]|nr:hypothetical protein [Thermoanaerobaculia bacterium]
MSNGKIKGSIMMGIIRFLRLHRQQARLLLPEHLQRYLDTRILATGWHPEEDYLELMRVLVQIRPQSRTRGVTPFEDAARDAATTHFEGPYKSLLRKGDPARTLSNLPALWRLRHDTGEAEVELPKEGEARVLLRGYSLVAPESCELTQGTLWGMVHHSGGEDIEVTHPSCRARGHDVCEWRLSWARAPDRS